MATIEISNGELVVGMHGWDRLFTMKSRLAVPLEHVAGAASAEDDARKWYKGLRFGTNIPGVLTAGTFYRQGSWVFWDVHDPALAIGIDLHDEHYKRLIVQVDDPAATIAAIEAAVGARVATASPT
ncbi:MAG: hypothetical protein IAI50_02145 [Candidatus Eremiobacteraeota bacterium]|nr:hypothetical protein [Candidatus Eremiobacteraeota bacterium]